MKEIQLTKGAVALVDDADFEYLNQFSWCLESSGYAGRKLRAHEGSRNTGRLMHHELLPDIIKGKKHVDHVDRNKLNNQKANLRYCNQAQNALNSPIKTASGLRGVRFVKRNPKNPYQAYINHAGKQQHLGYFPSEELAGAAYNAAALRLNPEFRALNKVS